MRKIAKVVFKNSRVLCTLHHLYNMSHKWLVADPACALGKSCGFPTELCKRKT